ncbi:hypothetical protein RRG08_001510 [Elysia crispata]|uniref:Uncharacterized protein n=1 Tax=Elysia crispata TaxID=231223 RepID=A0AAE1DVG0_9GAST|nr:hypothetical protein RRG08_001510 [Elysia crispata]
MPSLFPLIAVSHLRRRKRIPLFACRAAAGRRSTLFPTDEEDTKDSKMQQSNLWQVSILLVFLTFISIVSSMSLTREECLRSSRIDIICYECAKLHRTDYYEAIYTTCCDGQPEMRSYCKQMFSENSRAGGLWS